MRFAGVAAWMLLITACTELRPGSDINPVLLDTGTPPSGRDATAQFDATASDAESRDAAEGDATLARDAIPGDSDTEPGEDGGDGGELDRDAEPADDGINDAGDTGLPKCVPEWGEPCARSGTCGATYDCFGNCIGGTGAPACSCATPFCDLMSNQWTPCPDPPNFGDSCDTMTICGGRIDCLGACAGGAPLPTCACGTPTCNGCVGGTCDTNSTCTNGQCTCTVNDCSMDGSTYCWSGSLQTCDVDNYGCGALTNATMCPFGCVDFDLACGCSPDQGFFCSHSTCFCNCGDFDRPGEIQCDGSCSPIMTCFMVCRAECGPV